MRYVTLGEAVELHRRLLQATGGALGIRDFGALESATSIVSNDGYALVRPRWDSALASQAQRL